MKPPLSDRAGHCRRVTLEAGTDQVAEPEDPLVGGRVMHEQPFAAPGDQAGGVQHAEMTGDVGLRLAGPLNQLADGEFAFAKGIEQGQPGRFTQGPEPLRHRPEGGRWQAPRGHAPTAEPRAACHPA